MNSKKGRGVRAVPLEFLPPEDSARGGLNHLPSHPRLTKWIYQRFLNSVKIWRFWDSTGSASLCRMRYAYLRKKKTTDPLADLDPSLHLMVESNLRNVKKKQKGRRWSREKKLFYCTLYKRSPQTYRYLREKMSAPAPQTLISLINSFPLKPGINPTVFEHLTFRAKDMAAHNKYCTLLFDEMSIKPKLIYNASKKSVPGEILAQLIKEVINAIDKTGLKIVATICDMGSNNVKALKLLGYSYDNPFFLFDGREIFTMHDPPHLKCTRNMFMKYSVRGRVMLGGEMIQGLGRWSHIREIYGSARDIETTTMSCHLIPVKPLTEEHLNHTWRQKMKVGLAAGVFSLNVVKAMEWKAFSRLTCDHNFPWFRL
ncbi:hypothetical protein J437_LFUL019139 [Ladona fulva]|uniref:Uncharacterized protein n=1 Tax=Ladona fulva TaxID=123851 RepID=A0A8K0PAW5_LADFU|nr:hypothetical protein J437_LFUL019139 [Ladona fulva]